MVEQQLSPAKYKVLCVPDGCMPFETYKSLYLSGEFEQLGERCLTPWGCPYCRAHEKRVLLKK